MSVEQMEDDEINLMDLFIVLAKAKRLIIGLPLAVGVIAVVVMMLTPAKYTASTSLMPPVMGQSSAMALLGGVGGGLMVLAKNPSDIYVALIKSRTVEDALIKRFNLQLYYQTKYQVDTRKALEHDLSVKASKDGEIEIEYTHRDPKQSAAVANGAVDALRDLNSRLATTEAAIRRVYFERQLILAKDNLTEAEVSLKNFQQKTGVMQMEAQGGATLSQIATLEATITGKQVQLEGMKSFATKNNPDYVRVQRELEGLNSELAKLQSNGRGETRGVMIAKNKIPETGLEFAHRTRDVKYYETLYEIMAKQFEMAKADEAKEGALIQVVDVATAPERSSGPKRSMTVLLSMVLAFFFAMLWAFVCHAFQSATDDPKQAARIKELKREIGLS